MIIEAIDTGDGSFSFSITGVLGATVDIDFGDGSAPLRDLPVSNGTAQAVHTFVVPGQWTYTVTATSEVAGLYADLQALADAAPTLDALAATGATLRDWYGYTDVATAQVTAWVGRIDLNATLVDEPASDPLPFIQVELTMLSPDDVISWKIYRLADGWPETLLAEGTTTAGQELYEDHLAPLGVRVRYRAEVMYTDASAGVTSVSVTISGTRGCFLTNPYSGKTMAIQLIRWDERERAERRAIIGVLGRADPIVISDVHLWPSGEWRLRTRTDTENDQLTALLTETPIVYLRTQPASSIKNAFVSVGQITEVRRTGKGDDQERWFDVAIQEIAPVPATGTMTSMSLYGFTTIADTLAELASKGDTLAALARIRTAA